VPAPFKHLRDRAVELVARSGAADDAALLRYVYEAEVPPAVRDRLIQPLLADPRLARSSAGVWTLARADTPSVAQAPPSFVALALATTGARPERHRVVALAAVRMRGGDPAARLSLLVNPLARIPKYVAERIRVDPSAAAEWPPFDAVAAELAAFLRQEPICAMEAGSAVAFVRHELERAGCEPAARPVYDLGRLAERLLPLAGKPTLASIAQQTGVNALHPGRPDDDARVVASVAARLFPRASADDLRAASAAPSAADLPLRRRATADAAPDEPGVYVLRGPDDQALYVGKARRLRGRLSAYVDRPLAPRRLEGLADAVRSVQAEVLPSDLEALIAEDREIRRLRPRFNTQRQVRGRPTWIRLRAPPAPRRGRRQLARVRLELCEADDAAQARHLGPFPNPAEARAARDLARALFGLDRARAEAPPDAYADLLEIAWSFLAGDAEAGLAAARQGQALASAARDHDAARRWAGLLVAARDYAPAALVLPADPRRARFVVGRAGDQGIELFLVDRGILTGRRTFVGGEPAPFAAALLREAAPLTSIDDAPVVLRWLGAQHRPGRVRLVPDADAEAVHVVRDVLTEILDAVAAAAALEPPARPAGRAGAPSDAAEASAAQAEHPLEPF
jgi:DNA polymerase III subunit epsilon